VLVLRLRLPVLAHARRAPIRHAPDGGRSSFQRGTPAGALGEGAAARMLKVPFSSAGIFFYFGLRGGMATGGADK